MSKNSKSVKLTGSLGRTNEHLPDNKVILTIDPDCVDVFFDMLNSRTINENNQDILLHSISMDKEFLPCFSKEYATQIENHSNSIVVDMDYEFRERFSGQFTVFHGMDSISCITCPIIEFNLKGSKFCPDESGKTVFYDVVCRFVKAPIVRECPGRVL